MNAGFSVNVAEATVSWLAGLDVDQSCKPLL
jgi:hypothetical protein